jgi:hypothetical protein
MWPVLKTILKTAVYLIVIFCGLLLFSTTFHQRSMPGMGVAAGLCLLGFLGFVALFWGHRGFGRVMFVISLLVVLVGAGVFFLVPRPMAQHHIEIVPTAERPALLKKIETTATGAANEAVGESRKTARVEYKTRAVHSLSSVSNQLRSLQSTARAGDAMTIRETVRTASVSDSVTDKVAPAVAEAVTEAIDKGVPADAANEAAARGLDKAATAPNEVDRLLEGLQSANIAFNAPETLGYGRTFVIKLELSANKTPEELAGIIHEPGPTETATVKISNEMDARLTGEQFEIKAVRPERQAVSANGTEWSWDIKPRELGRQKLHLTLDAVLKIDNHESTYTLKTFDKTIGVNVVWPDTWLVFFGKYWQWIVTTIVIPFVVWLGKKIFKG